MAGVPINFAVPSEGAVASYSYTDIATGLGYQTFYLAATRETTNIEYLTTDKAFYSDPESIGTDNLVTSGFEKVQDVDFDTNVFNSPRTVKGTAIMNVASSLRTLTAYKARYLIINVIHFDGTTETNIGSVQTITKEQSGTSGTWKYYEALQIPLTETLFKKGDILRINIQYWLKSGNSNGGTQIYFQPTDNTNDQNTKRTEINIPFKLDL